MCGLAHGLGRMYSHISFLLLSFAHEHLLLFSVFGVFFLGLFLDPNRANSVAALFLSVSALVGSGFLRSAETIPGIFQKLSFLTVFRYSSEIMYVNEFEGLELSCAPLLPCEYPSGDDYLAVMYPDAPDRMGKNFGALFLMVLIALAGTIALFRFNKKSLR